MTAGCFGVFFGTFLSTLALCALLFIVWAKS